MEDFDIMTPRDNLLVAIAILIVWAFTIYLIAEGPVLVKQQAVRSYQE